MPQARDGARPRVGAGFEGVAAPASLVERAYDNANHCPFVFFPVEESDRIKGKTCFPSHLRNMLFASSRIIVLSTYLLFEHVFLVPRATAS